MDIPSLSTSVSSSILYPCQRGMTLVQINQYKSPVMMLLSLLATKLITYQGMQGCDLHAHTNDGVRGVE